MSIKEIRDEINKGILNEIQGTVDDYKYIKISSTHITIEDLFEETEENLDEGYVITDLFHTLQGVTIGGKGSTNIFSDVEGNVDIDGDLVLKSIGGRNIIANKIIWTDEYMIFPYTIKDENFIPAFYDEKLEEDTLNFDINLDASEIGFDRHRKLTYRIAKGYIKYPMIAEYICKFYEDLYYREFEKKHILDYNKSWYEFHRSRWTKIISAPKIVCRRLMKTPSFAIDEEGYLPKDSVISLIPKETFDTFLEELNDEIDQDINILNGYHYILSFLNSEEFSRYLANKRAKKQGGYLIVGNKMFQNFIIPFPSSLDEDEISERMTPI